MVRVVDTRGLLALAVMNSALSFGLANAQQSTPPSAASAQQTQTTGEIIVTAQKRRQSVNSVGMAITAVTGTQLKALNIAGVGDLQKVDPSFVFSQAQRGEPVYSIRGVGYNDFSLAASPTVSVYTDEAPYAYPVMTKGAPFDLDRVEILKGPQGTLFGQNATGGAINYIASKPTTSLAAGVEATYARFGATNVNGFVSGPLTDTLKARGAFNIDEGGAWQKSDTRNATLGSKHNEQGRLILDWTPNDRLTISTNINGWVDRSDTQAGQEIGLFLQTPAYASLVPDVVNEPLSPKNDRSADWLAGLRPHNDEHFYQGSLRVDYRVSDQLRLTYLGTYENYTQHDISDNIGQNVDFYLKLNGFVDYTSQEIRASGDLINKRLTWLLGVDYSRTNTVEDQDETLLDSTSAYALTRIPLALGQPALAPFVGVNNVSKDINIGKAVFANTEYHLFKDLDIHAGVRYTQTDIDHGGCTRDIDGNAAAGFTALETLVKKGVGVVPAVQGGCVTLGPQLTPGYVTQTLDQNNVSWRLGADWKPNTRTLVYLTVSKGYKSGSFPTLTASSYLQLKPVTQESVLSYETGLKSRFLDNRVELDGAIFHYDYDNKQLEAREPDPEHVFGFLNVLLNVPRSAEDGAELTAIFRPISSLTVSLRGTYIDSHVEKAFYNYNPYSNVAINLEGEPFPNAPRWTSGADAQYRWAVWPGYSAFVGSDVRFQSQSQAAFGAESAIAQGYPSYLIKSYSVLDLRAGVSSANGHWHAEVFGNNVTNTYYWTQVARPGEAVVRLTGMPTVYGLKLGYDY